MIRTLTFISLILDHTKHMDNDNNDEEYWAGDEYFDDQKNAPIFNRWHYNRDFRSENEYNLDQFLNNSMTQDRSGEKGKGLSTESSESKPNGELSNLNRSVEEEGIQDSSSEKLNQNETKIRGKSKRKVAVEAENPGKRRESKQDSDSKTKYSNSQSNPYNLRHTRKREEKEIRKKQENRQRKEAELAAMIDKNLKLEKEICKTEEVIEKQLQGQWFNIREATKIDLRNDSLIWLDDEFQEVLPQIKLFLAGKLFLNLKKFRYKNAIVKGIQTTLFPQNRMGIELGLRFSDQEQENEHSDKSEKEEDNLFTRDTKYAKFFRLSTDLELQETLEISKFLNHLNPAKDLLTFDRIGGSIDLEGFFGDLARPDLERLGVDVKNYKLYFFIDFYLSKYIYGDLNSKYSGLLYPEEPFNGESTWRGQELRGFIVRKGEMQENEKVLEELNKRLGEFQFGRTICQGEEKDLEKFKIEYDLTDEKRKPQPLVHQSS